MKNLPFGKILILLFILIFIPVVLFMIKIIFQNDVNGSVKGVIYSPIQDVTPIPTETPIPTTTPIQPSATPTPTPTPTPIVLKKSSYSIAIIGDSMVDTMGERLEYLEKTLINKYPRTEFKLYNYGIGGQNIEQGLGRFESSFVNRDRNYPPIPAIVPDVLIIGSFAYNPFSTHDRNKHYTLLRELVAKAKTASPQIYLLAEISPLKNNFGKGINGVNMPPNVAYQHALNIIEQLDDVINLSRIENIPLINVYYESRIDGTFGNPSYVNPDDGIHPSAVGHIFTSEVIVDEIKLD